MSEPSRLRLYVAGDQPSSRLARTRLAELCARYRCECETIDVLEEPARALADEVALTPALLRIAPLPRVRIVGDLHDPAAVIEALELEAG